MNLEMGKGASKERMVGIRSDLASPDEINRALERMKSDPVLRTDEYAEGIVKKGGLVDHLPGEPFVVDLDSFLSERISAIQAGEKLRRTRMAAAADVAEIEKRFPGETIH